MMMMMMKKEMQNKMSLNLFIWYAVDVHKAAACCSKCITINLRQFAQQCEL